MHLTIYIAGAVRDGSAGAGVAIEEESKPLVELRKALDGVTSIQAEYHAAILGLQQAIKMKATSILLVSSQTTIVGQLGRTTQVRDTALQSLYVEAWELCKKIEHCSFEYRPRSENFTAFAQAKYVCNNPQSQTNFES